MPASLPDEAGVECVSTDDMLSWQAAVAKHASSFKVPALDFERSVRANTSGDSSMVAAAHARTQPGVSTSGLAPPPPQPPSPSPGSALVSLAQSAMSKMTSWQAAVTKAVSPFFEGGFVGFAQPGQVLTYAAVISLIGSGLSPVRALVDPAVPQIAVVGDESGKLTRAFMEMGEKAIAICPSDAPEQLAVLRYKGLAQDILPRKYWKLICLALPCGPHSLSGIKRSKIDSGEAYWGIFDNVHGFACRSDAVLMESAPTIIKGVWRPPTQEVNAFHFGLDDKGRVENKKICARVGTVLDSHHGPCPGR